ncbi:MAG: tyrosine-type recombinase/integrase [Patescibacteria group bacterium]|nr:tyrosine-type recombinase/integrase [Patescibacteria group bacterium]
MKKSTKAIRQHLNDFLDWIDIEKGLSAKSQENYARFLKRFFEWIEINKLNNLKPHELTPEHIFKYKTFLSRQYTKKNKKPLKRNTQNYYLIALRSLLTFFADRDIISLPPEKIKLAKQNGIRKVNFLTLDQVEKLLDAPNTSTIIGKRDKAILETLFSTGLRVAELVALNREQFRIELSGKELEIGIIGKGGYPRTVFISERAISSLKTYLKTRTDKNKALFIGYKGRKSQTRLTARTIERIIKKYVVMVGLPIITSPHTLRHTFASDLLTKGVDLRIIQEFLGHRSISTTQVYTHITRPQLKEIHQKYHGTE